MFSMPDDSLEVVEQIEERHLGLPFSLAGEKNRPLRKFFKDEAIASSNANLTRTYVLLDPDKASVIGFVSIMCASIKIDKGTYEIPEKPKAQRFLYHPACCIARLATCDSYRKQGYGRKLVELASGIAQTFISPHVGCRFLYVNSKKDSVSFYEKIGFTIIDTEDNRARDEPVLYMDLSKLPESLDGETPE